MRSELSSEAEPVEVGRILENVHAQQSKIHGMLATLDTRARDLDANLGEAVQRAFIDASGIHAAEKLSQIHRATGLRFALWSFGIVSACALVPALLTWALMPSRAQVLQSRQVMEQLNAAVNRLTQEGGRMELKRCGEKSRLCVRVDRKSPFYGDEADFAVLKGY